MIILITKTLFCFEEETTKG